MQVRHQYVVRLDDYLTETKEGFTCFNEIRGIPTTGSIVASPKGYPQGNRISFQWNALADVEFDSRFVLINPDMVYVVDKTFLNDYLWIKLASDESKTTAGQGIVVGSSHPVYKKGMTVWFDAKLSHRVTAPEFTNTHLYAVKGKDILLYKE